ncbi:uncharacterized protein G2W53_000569 [Senna tora]|uniref:Uncharacterized protein n=1 Tax=Senna tora TaxID=362788 RepID=A0A834XG02_9FABA|nr:uncharacterized protein G2W53_000569 [Senna tora]
MTRRRFSILVIIGLAALFRGYVPLMVDPSKPNNDKKKKRKLPHRKLPSEVGGESDASKELRTDVGDETKVEARQQIDTSDEEWTLLLTRSKCWVCLDPPWEQKGLFEPLLTAGTGKKNLRERERCCYGGMKLRIGNHHTISYEFQKKNL